MAANGNIIPIALLTYSADPNEVGVSTSSATTQVSITITIVNQTPDSLNLASVNFTLPQGTDDDDLVAPNTWFSAGNVQSPNGTSWSVSMPALIDAVALITCATSYGA
jgi:hypothetical protein